MGSSPVGVQCTFKDHFPCVSVLCLPFQNVHFLVTPLLYIVQAFSFRSSAFCFSFHECFAGPQTELYIGTGDALFMSWQQPCTSPTTHAEVQAISICSWPKGV